MEFETERVIDCNGQKVRIGWDEFGWFTIQHGVMVDGEFQAEEGNFVNIPPEKTEDIIKMIEKR